MPVNEREKKELEKKIKNQRRAMWKGTVDRGRARGTRTLKKQQKPEEQVSPAQSRSAWRETAATKEPSKTAQVSEIDRPISNGGQQNEKEKLARKITEQRRAVWKGQPETDRKYARRSSIPSLKLALLVITGLIGAILAGVAIGYLAAIRDLINI